MNFYEKILFVFTNDVFLCLAELAANAERIQSVLSMGQNLIERIRGENEFIGYLHISKTPVITGNQV